MLKENWKKIVVHSVVLLTVATDASRRIDQGTSSSALNGNGFYSDGIPKREKIASQKESVKLTCPFCLLWNPWRENRKGIATPSALLPGCSRVLLDPVSSTVRAAIAF